MMITLDCPYVSTSEAGDEIFQVLFEAVRNDNASPYLLLQRACLEEIEGTGSIYVELKEERLIGHYRSASAELSTNRLTVQLPGTRGDTIAATFDATKTEFMQLCRMLKIIFGKGLSVVD